MELLDFGLAMALLALTWWLAVRLLAVSIRRSAAKDDAGNSRAPKPVPVNRRHHTWSPAHLPRAGAR